MNQNQRFKVGDRVRIKAVQHPYIMGHLIGNTFEIVNIDSSYQGERPYEIVDPVKRDHWWFGDDELRLTVITLDTLEVGDVLIYDDDEYTVLAVCGRAVLLSADNDPDTANVWYATQELKDKSYTIKETGEEVEELTVAEVEKRLGKRVKIIKDNQ